jgi:hypothetical protein
LLKSSKTKFSLEDKKTKKDLFAFDAVFWFKYQNLY